MRTCVYVDGFNLYYGAVRKTAYKWLDLRALCRHLLPPNDVLRIKYFTALVGLAGGIRISQSGSSSILIASQFPGELVDETGSFVKPAKWS